MKRAVVATVLTIGVLAWFASAPVPAPARPERVPTRSPRSVVHTPVPLDRAATCRDRSRRRRRLCERAERRAGSLPVRRHRRPPHRARGDSSSATASTRRGTSRRTRRTTGRRGADISRARIPFPGITTTRRIPLPFRAATSGTSATGCGGPTASATTASTSRPGAHPAAVCAGTSSRSPRSCVSPPADAAPRRRDRPGSGQPDVPVAHRRSPSAPGRRLPMHARLLAPSTVLDLRRQRCDAPDQADVAVALRRASRRRVERPFPQLSALVASRVRPAGTTRSTIREFVAGTGGASTYPFLSGVDAPNLAFAQHDAFGSSALLVPSELFVEVGARRRSAVGIHGRGDRGRMRVSRRDRRRVDHGASVSGPPSGGGASFSSKNTASSVRDRTPSFA